MPGYRFNQDVGSPQNQRAIAVIDATPTPVNITGIRYATIEIYNPGPNTVYFGSSSVTDATGMPILPNDYRLFKGVQNGFVLYLICSSGQTQSVNLMEYP